MSQAHKTCLSVVTALIALSSAAVARADIKRPGDHLKYNVELEPHLVVQWEDDSWYDDDDGLGVGLRASIPVIDNGPVTSINNNFAITFGLDWAHVGGCGPYNCDSDDFWLPLAVQWNFFFTKVVSLFPELGLALHHSELNWDGPIPTTCGRINGVNVCRGDTDTTHLDFVFWLGGRFTLADNFALTIRIGTPSVLFGASFML